MARPAGAYPTELELEILKVVWRDEPATVSHVRKALVPFRKLAHTSVMTVMGIMTEKGYLARTKSGNRYLYTSKVGRDDTTGGILSDVVTRAFEGSASAAVLNLLETSDLDAEELKKLRKLISQRIMED